MRSFIYILPTVCVLLLLGVSMALENQARRIFPHQCTPRSAIETLVSPLPLRRFLDESHRSSSPAPPVSPQSAPPLVRQVPSQLLSGSTAKRRSVNEIQSTTSHTRENSSSNISEEERQQLLNVQKVLEAELETRSQAKVELEKKLYEVEHKYQERITKQNTEGPSVSCREMDYNIPFYYDAGT
ncbi:hypothetical protein PROFUN_09579 [Planoprotostelium fungivorum]|uniref:Uncharacterized protein n=1 Tax=Planoprotostelium fungivorum TaxID=1890364 RepID=A0A2P6NGT6_9EUKA|nr:hypothetical protein PROFUN_09579 [Planoprotostelium fungivorum]